MKILEGTSASVPPQGGRKHPHQEFIQIDTTNILFICGGAFAGLDRIIESRVGKTGMGFRADVRRGHKHDESELFLQVLPQPGDSRLIATGQHQPVARAQPPGHRPAGAAVRPGDDRQGLGAGPGQRALQMMLLESRNSSSPYSPRSRPRPLCLYPPKAVCGLDPAPPPLM